jgi:hypothetical protein
MIGRPRFESSKAGQTHISARDLNGLRRQVERLSQSFGARTIVDAAGFLSRDAPRSVGLPRVGKITHNQGTSPGLPENFRYRARSLDGMWSMSELSRPLIQTYNDNPKCLVAPVDSYCLMGRVPKESGTGTEIRIIACAEKLNFEACSGSDFDVAPGELDVDLILTSSDGSVLVGDGGNLLVAADAPEEHPEDYVLVGDDAEPMKGEGASPLMAESGSVVNPAYFDAVLFDAASGWVVGSNANVLEAE